MPTLAKNLPGITTCLGVLDKGGLKIASARLAANRLRELQAAGQDIAKLDGWKLVDEVWSGRAQRGTDGHSLGELLTIQYAHGQALTDSFIVEMMEKASPLASDDLYLGAMAIRNWLERTKPSVHSTEIMCGCMHCGYCATLDLVCTIDGERWVIDMKWAKDLFDSYGLQIVGQIHALENTAKGWTIERKDYRGAHRYTIEHADNAPLPPHLIRQEMRGGLLWVSPKAKDGCELVPVDTSIGALESFYAVLAAWKWRRADRWRLSA